MLYYNLDGRIYAFNNTQNASSSSFLHKRFGEKLWYITWAIIALLLLEHYHCNWFRSIIGYDA